MRARYYRFLTLPLVVFVLVVLVLVFLNGAMSNSIHGEPQSAKQKEKARLNLSHEILAGPV